MASSAADRPPRGRSPSHPGCRVRAEAEQGRGVPGLVCRSGTRSKRGYYTAVELRCSLNINPAASRGDKNREPHAASCCC